jgi:hypothetical protein
MPDDDQITRREFEELRIEVRSLTSNNTAIAVLTTQLQTLQAALVKMENNITERFAAHERVHQKDVDARSSGRRWLIGTAITGLAVLVGLYGWVALLLHKGG